MKIGYYISAFLTLASVGCVKDASFTDGQDVSETRASVEESEIFYYYGVENKKIALSEVKDKIVVKFAPTTTKERFRAVVSEGRASLRTREFDAERYFVEGGSSNIAVLEGAGDDPDLLASFKAREEIVSATYLLDCDGSSVALTDKFIVKLKGGTTLAQLQELAGKYDCIVGKENEFVEDQFTMHVTKTSELNSMQTANLFYETGLFEFSEPDFTCFDVLNAVDPYYFDQWGLHNPTSPDVDIDMLTAAMITKGSGSISIAILDNGVQSSHPDFYWMPSGNDFTGTTGIPGGSMGEPVRNDDNHGTAVAGVAAALSDNGIGIAGVAPGCRIMPIKVANGTSVNWSHVADGVNWAKNNGVDVINMSMGDHNAPSSALTNAIRSALTNGRSDVGRGCVVVCASGNDKRQNPTGQAVEYPANCHPDIIVVGASDRTGARAAFSDFGPQVDVIAPGAGILTTDRTGSDGYNRFTDLNYTYADGTSFAAPAVSGIAALLLSIDKYFTPQRISEIITSTSSLYPARTDQAGYGLVNAHDALAKVLYLDNPSVQISGSASPKVNSTVGYTCPIFPYASIVTFDHWEVSGGNYETSSLSTRDIFSLKFTSAGLHTITAYYNFSSTGYQHRVSKTVNVVL